MKKIYILLFAAALGACGDFLEPASQSEYIPRDATALNEMLLGNAYPRGSNGRAILDILTVLDDDICCTDIEGQIDMTQDASRYIGLKALFGWQSDAFVTLNDLAEFNAPNNWANYYALIVGANAALDYIDDVSGSDDEKNDVKAQAYALRAFFYFQLVNIWGEPYSHNKDALGVPLKTTSELEDRELPRNKVSDVYAQVIADLDEAERLYGSLPESMRFRRNYRTNLPMVLLLKSRVYLYMEDWENAALYAGRVIADPEFSLNNLNTVPEKTEKTPRYNFISFDSPETIWLFGEIQKYLTYIRSWVYIDDPTDASLKIGICFFNASPDLLELYADGDLRKNRYIDREIYIDKKENRHTAGYLPYGKFAVNENNAPISGESFAHAFRLSEAYLNLAEAAARLNDAAIALEALNTLRRNRFTPETYSEITGVSGEELIGLVQIERRLELCYEGHRWFDLRRWGMPSLRHEWKEVGKVVQTYTLPQEDPFYTLPIHPEVLEKNRNLVQNKLSNPR